MTTPELIALIEGQQRCADAARCVEVRNHHQSNIGLYATGILDKLKRLERAEELLRDVRDYIWCESTSAKTIDAFIREGEA